MSTTPATKRRRLSADGVPPSSESKVNQDFYQRAAEWNLEQTYERAPRKQKKNATESTRLPVKTMEGRLAKSELPERVSEDEDGWLDSEVGEVRQEPEGEQTHIEDKTPLREQITNAKEELARIASLINEDPEENAGAFQLLGQIANTTNPTIKSLALATQMAIFKDVIPGYRIRPLSEGDQKEKLSKDVRRLRAFEQSLVKSYQSYLKDLTVCARYGLGETPLARDSVQTVAVSCACALILAVPHFNFRGELLKLIVGKLSARSVNANFFKCRDTLIELFQDDNQGSPSLDAVSLLTKMMKARNYQVDESVISLFLHLRLLSDFFLKASQNRVDREEHDERSGKAPKFKKEFRTKKLRKILKEQKAVEKDFREADAVVSREEREKMQAETLKMVFVTYFRILKARTPSLMGAVLEGLAKYAHLINQEFFGDLLEALKDLIRDTDTQQALHEDSQINDGVDTAQNSIEIWKAPSNRQQRSHQHIRQKLLCINTAFALLEGQDVARSAASLNLDLSFFNTHLYKILPLISTDTDLELSSQTPRLPDPDTPAQNSFSSVSKSKTPTESPTATATATATTAADRPKINIMTPSALLIRCLTSAISPRSTPPMQLASFTKILHTCALQLPEKSTRATLTLLTNTSKNQARKIGSLWRTEERSGNGKWDPCLIFGDGGTPAGTGTAAAAAPGEWGNPFASSIWEGELLRLHYAPEVRDALKALEQTIGQLGE